MSETPASQYKAGKQPGTLERLPYPEPMMGWSSVVIEDDESEDEFYGMDHDDDTYIVDSEDRVVRHYVGGQEIASPARHDGSKTEARVLSDAKPYTDKELSDLASMYDQRKETHPHARHLARHDADRARIAELEGLLKEVGDTDTDYEAIIDALRAEVEELKEECFTLSAHACKEGKWDDYGNWVCHSTMLTEAMALLEKVRVACDDDPWDGWGRMGAEVGAFLDKHPRTSTDPGTGIPT